MVPTNETSDKVQWKCSLLQSILLCNQSKFAETAQGVKQRIQKINDENGVTKENDLHAVLSEGSYIA